MTMDATTPAPNDYVQLLDGDGNPTENFTVVAQLISSFEVLALEMFVDTVHEIENPSGERYNVIRNEDGDTDLVKCWLQIDEPLYFSQGFAND